MHFGRVTDRRSGPFGGLERIRFGLSIREYAAGVLRPGSVGGGTQNHVTDVPGTQFLRHLARTRLLLHVVDIAPPDPAADPVADARAVVNELGKFDPGLADKPRWLVLNKIDLVPEDERAARTQAFAKALRYEGPLFAISAIDGRGCRELSFAIQDWLDEHRPTSVTASEAQAGDEPTVVTPAPVAPRRRRKNAGDMR